MSAPSDLLLPHLEGAVRAIAEGLGIAGAHAGNLVSTENPTPSLPFGGVRLIRAVLADGMDVDLVIGLTDDAVNQVCAGAGTDNLTNTLAPAILGALNELGTRSGLTLDLADLDEMILGTPWGPPGTESATAGLFAGEDQIGNVIFLLLPEGATAAASGNDAGIVAGRGSASGMGTSNQLAMASFPDADLLQTSAAAHPLSMLRGVEMRVTAELGRTRLPVSHLLDLGPGSVVELDRIAGTPVDVLVNGTVIAHGEVVVIDDEYGVRITEIVGAEDTW